MRSEKQKGGEVILFQAEDGKTRLEVHLDHDTVWLSQDQLSKLFQRERSVITKHLGNLFREEELDKKSNVQNMHIANSDRPVVFYNLDVIISIGYRLSGEIQARHPISPMGHQSIT